MPVTLALFQQLLDGELDHYVTDKRYLRPDGSEIWASVSITTVREPDGRIDVLFGQMVDITERKAREASLHVQLDDITWLGEIRRAFEEDRFELHAQPIVDLATGETVQRELLIRMRDTDGKLIPPGDFLPAAEKHGAIRDIDRWVLAQGADLAARGIDVEINISAASIGDPGLIADIEHELARTGADPSRLVFEITETALVEETEVAVTLAERLRHLGCRFALDDFGSGYGGFHYLKHLPMDFLKIDREFVRDARSERGRPARDPRDRRAGPRVRPEDHRRGRRGPGDARPAARLRRRLRPGLPRPPAIQIGTDLKTNPDRRVRRVPGERRALGAPAHVPDAAATSAAATTRPAATPPRTTRRAGTRSSARPSRARTGAGATRTS